MICQTCNCPLIVLRTASGKKERRHTCARCLEEESLQSQVDVLMEHAKELEPEIEADMSLAPVLRIDQYLKGRGKRSYLM